MRITSFTEYVQAKLQNTGSKFIVKQDQSGQEYIDKVGFVDWLKFKVKVAYRAEQSMRLAQTLHAWREVEVANNRKAHRSPLERSFTHLGQQLLTYDYPDPNVRSEQRFREFTGHQGPLTGKQWNALHKIESAWLKVDLGYDKKLILGDKGETASNSSAISTASNAANARLASEIGNPAYQFLDGSELEESDVFNAIQIKHKVEYDYSTRSVTHIRKATPLESQEAEEMIFARQNALEQEKLVKAQEKASKKKTRRELPQEKPKLEFAQPSFRPTRDERTASLYVPAEIPSIPDDGVPIESELIEDVAIATVVRPNGSPKGTSVGTIEVHAVRQQADSSPVIKKQQEPLFATVQKKTPPLPARNYEAEAAPAVEAKVTVIKAVETKKAPPVPPRKHQPVVEASTYAIPKEEIVKLQEEAEKGRRSPVEVQYSTISSKAPSRQAIEATQRAQIEVEAQTEFKKKGIHPNEEFKETLALVDGTYGHQIREIQAENRFFNEFIANTPERRLTGKDYLGQPARALTQNDYGVIVSKGTNFIVNRTFIKAVRILVEQRAHEQGLSQERVEAISRSVRFVNPSPKANGEVSDAYSLALRAVAKTYDKGTGQASVEEARKVQLFGVNIPASIQIRLRDLSEVIHDIKENERLEARASRAKAGAEFVKQLDRLDVAEREATIERLRNQAD